MYQIINNEAYLKALDQHVIVSMTDASGTIIACNDRFCQVSGYSREELIGNSHRLIKSGIQSSSFYDQLWGTITAGQVWSGEVCNRRMDGSLFWVYTRVTPLLDENGLPVQYLSTRTDVTDRRQSNELLLKSTSTIADLYHNSPCGYHSLNPQGIFQIINDTELAWLGYSREELLGKMKWSDLLAPESVLVFEKTFPLLIKQGFAKDVELEIVRKDGTTFTGLLNASAIYDPDGHFVMSRASIFDITARKAAQAALTASNERLRLIMETIDEVFWMADAPIERIEYISPGYERIWGRTTQSLYENPRSFIEAIHPDDVERVISDLGSQRTGQPFSHEYRIVRPDGAIRWVWDRGFPVQDNAGKVTSYAGIAQDITERKLAEDLLRESEAHQRAILDNSPYLIWLKDTDGRYLKVNASYAQTAGVETTEQAIGKTDLDIWPKELADKYRVDDAHVIATRQSIRVEEPALDGDRRHWVETFKTPIFDENHNVLGTVGFARDITERKLAEQLLFQQKSLIRQIIDSDPNMISVKDADGRFLAVNQAMAELHGKSPRELVGQPGAAPFLPDGTPDPVYQADREVLATMQPVELVTHDLLNGREHWFHITKIPLKQPDGRVHVLGIGVDITEKRNAEQQLHDLTAHIQTVREEEKASIAREIHDDLGSTLTALKIEIYWLEREVTEGGNVQPLIERIQAMSQLVDNAVYTTRRVISDLHPTILDDLGLLAALEWQAGQFQKRTGIECRVSCTRACNCEAEVSKIQSINLFRIFQEALTNIARHSGASKVLVEFNNGRDVTLYIRDNGCGLPEGHTIASTSYGMRGMTERVTQMGGMIVFDSPPGGGFSVAIKLSVDNTAGDTT